MTTRDPLWNPNSRQPAGVEHWKTYLRDPLHGSVGDVLRSLFPAPCVLSEAWPVVYAAGKVSVDTTATRGAVMEDADGHSRLVRPVAAAGSGEWFETLAGSAGFADVWFPDTPAIPYYVSLRYELIPVQARTLGEPSTTGALAEYRFDVYQERIGRQGVPDLVTEPIVGQLQFRLDTLIGPTLWADNPAKTRQVVIWKAVPATGGVEAVAIVDGLVSGGHFIATVPHTFGQTAGSASVVAADYGACVLGPVVDETDCSADPRHALLATVTTGVVSYTTSNIVDVPEQTDDRLDELEAWVAGYQGGPGVPYGVGAFLGGNAVQSGWNDITLTIPVAGTVKADFIDNPFTVAGISNAFFYADGQFLKEWESGVDWTDYRFTPGGAPGTFTICVEAVDETGGATPKWTARLTTIAGTYATALLAGKLPLIQYDWTGAALGPVTVIPLRMFRGERRHETIGGPMMFLATDDGRPGSVALRVASEAAAGSKGVERLHLLADDDDDTAAATIAFERYVDTLDALPGHVMKIAAQANAPAQTTDAEFAAVQLGGAGDLSLVGRTVGGVRQVAIGDATNPLTKEILVLAEDGGKGDVQVPAGSLKYPTVIAGDYSYLGGKGKINSRRVPLGNVGDGWRTYDNATTAMILGPWVYGSNATGGVQPALADIGNWWWLWFPVGGVPDPAKPLYIEITPRYREYFTDCDLLASNGNDGGDAVVTWSVVRVADDGTETEWVVSKTGANNDWLTNDIAEYRRPSEHGNTGADYPAPVGPGVDWDPDTHLFHMEIGYRWFVKFTPSVTLGWNKISVRGVIVHMRRYEA